VVEIFHYTKLIWNRHGHECSRIWKLSGSSSTSKSVEIFWAEIYWGRLFLKAESSLIQSSCQQNQTISNILTWHLLGHAIKSVTCFDLQFSCSTRSMTSFCIFIAYINTEGIIFNVKITRWDWNREVWIE
jgi:hypothetical protein